MLAPSTPKIQSVPIDTRCATIWSTTRRVLGIFEPLNRPGNIRYSGRPLARPAYLTPQLQYDFLPARHSSTGGCAAEGEWAARDAAPVGAVSAAGKRRGGRWGWGGKCTGHTLTAQRSL